MWFMSGWEGYGFNGLRLKGFKGLPFKSFNVDGGRFKGSRVQKFKG